MAFKDTYRLEKVYYENMWTLLKSLKALKENPSADEITKVNEILDDTIACNESIIIIYKNLGELYAEVAQKFVDLLTDLKAIRDDLEMWKNEINEKIDDVNNYLMGHIRDLDDRVTSLEGRVSDLEDRMTTAENDIDSLEGRMDTAEGDIDALEGRMDTAEDDIDGLQDDVSDLQQNKQDKLTAGFGIEIDANNEISVDTNDVQEKLIAGQNITFTPDATDPTKTVIDAQGGHKVKETISTSGTADIGPVSANNLSISIKTDINGMRFDWSRTGVFPMRELNGYYYISDLTTAWADQATTPSNLPTGKYLLIGKVYVQISRDSDHSLLADFAYPCTYVLSNDGSAFIIYGFGDVTRNYFHCNVQSKDTGETYSFSAKGNLYLFAFDNSASIPNTTAFQTAMKTAMYNFIKGMKLNGITLSEMS